MAEQSRSVATRNQLVSFIFDLLDENDAIEWKNDTAYQFLQAVAESLDRSAGDATEVNAWQAIADAFHAATTLATGRSTPA